MRALALCLLLLGSFGCGPTTPPKCTSATCTGCCDPTSGACEPGTSPNACGSSGLTCTTCGPNTFCNVGFCRPLGANQGGGTGQGGGGGGGGAMGGGGGSSACGPATCAGCCLEGVCLAGSSSSACGSGGESCSACGSGQRCSDNQCVGDTTCNAATCPTGCCKFGVCETSPSATNCGLEGSQCVTCGAGQACLGGQCVGTTSCSAATCPNGCCNGNVCELGTSGAACGTGGAACTTCGSGQSCSAGRCVTTSSCNAQTCPTGCCNGNVCELGTASAACGSGGGACTSCGSGQSCSAGRCVANASCTSATCPNGCCNGNVCELGTAASACGSGGNACTTCGSGLSCNGGQCLAACNAQNCPTGCCRGGVCELGATSQACGTGGAACATCTSTQSCTGSACVANCSPTTCASGCCQNNTCVTGTSASACGTGGGTCAVCSSNQSCNGTSCSTGTQTGDACDTAPLLTLPSSVSQSLTGYANDFTSTSTTCKGRQGLDRVVRVTVPAGQTLTATVTPTVNTFDPTLNLVVGSASACVGSAATCVAAADVGGDGEAEIVRWTNSGNSAVSVFIIVENYDTADTGGAYTLEASAATAPTGETCNAPIVGTSGASITRTIQTYASDYSDVGSGCVTPALGPDFVVAYSVPNNRSISVTATPVSPLNVTVNFAASLADCSGRVCVAGANAGDGGVAETAAWNNTTGATATVYAIIDSPEMATGSVTVVGTEGALIPCGPSTCGTGCCSNGVCVAGASDTACGSGGAACATCSSPAQCNASRTCSATNLDTGSPCATSDQCYQPVFGAAECRTTWPGGYCTGTCLLTEQSCGGFFGLGQGWCTPQGECLQECTAPGAGQSSCRNGYVCDFSNGVGSQGVCRPRCQQVPCATGTCNASGYCR